METIEPKKTKRKKNGESKKGVWRYLTFLTIIITFGLTAPAMLNSNSILKSIIIYLVGFVILMGFNLIFYLFYGTRVPNKTRRVVYVSYFALVFALAVGLIEMHFDGYTPLVFIKGFGIALLIGLPFVLLFFIISLFGKRHR